jgi:predicted transcriptional regulator
MTEQATFTLKLEPALHAEFTAAAAAEDRSAAQVMQEFIRGYIAQSREEREYNAYVRRKVEKAQKSMQAGRGIPSEEVRAYFKAKREALVARQT